MPCNGRNLVHHLSLTRRTLKPVHRVPLYTGLCKRGASGESATTAVGGRQQFQNLTHTGVLLNLELS